MGRPRKEVDKNLPKSWRFQGVRGGVRQRNGRLSLRIGDGDVALDMEYSEANLKKAEKELRKIQKELSERRVAERVARKLGHVSLLGRSNGALPTHDDDEAPPATVFEAQKLFRSASLTGRTPDILARYAALYKEIWPEDEPFSEKRIRAAVERWYAQLTGTPGTINGKRARVVKFIKYLQSQGWIRKNPLHDKRPPKPHKREARIYSNEEQANILSSLGAIRTKGVDAQVAVDLTLCLRYSAMRVREALALMDVDAVPASTRHEVSWADDTVVMIRNTKTREDRKLPLGALPELAEVIARRRAVAHQHGGQLFPIKYQTYLNRFNLSIDKHSIHIADGVKPIHVLRATCLMDWRRKGFPAELRAELAGHDEETARTSYTASRPLDELIEAIERSRTSTE